MDILIRRHMSIYILEDPQTWLEILLSLTSIQVSSTIQGLISFVVGQYAVLHCKQGDLRGCGERIPSSNMVEGAGDERTLCLSPLRRSDICYQRI
jgi:hypothetical protein